MTPEPISGAVLACPSPNSIFSNCRRGFAAAEGVALMLTTEGRVWLTSAVNSSSRAARPGRRLVMVTAAALAGVEVSAFFQNPFADLDKSRTAPLEIDNALITPLPTKGIGWTTAICIFSFMAFFAVGPGVCVWLALSELMPTRIRSNGMSIALLINQAVSTTIAAVFLPTVGKYGYSAIFLAFAACTVVYFITATFFLPETKGKTLEEIEEHFEGGKPSLKEIAV